MRPALCLFALAIALGAAPAWVAEASAERQFGVPRERIVASVRNIGVIPVTIPDNVPNRLKVARRLEAAIEAQLRAGGFQIVPAEVMRATRDDLADALGGLYDPVTGKPVQAQHKALDGYVSEQYESKNEIDVWLRPAVVLRTVVAKGGQASWDGVVEPATVQATPGAKDSGSGVLQALSLQIRLTDYNGKLLYLNQGGLQLTSALYNDGNRTRPVAADPAHLMEDPERDSRALMIALQPLASGEPVPAAAKLPPVRPVPLVANSDALRLPRSELLAGFARVALLPLSMAEGAAPPELIARYKDLLETRLKAAGFEVVNAGEAGAALERLRRSAPGFFNAVTGDFDQARWEAARQAILKEQGQRLNVQAIADPRMVMASASLSGNDASWDGAREGTAKGKSQLGKPMVQDAAAAETIPAWSLRLSISDLEGRTLFEEQAGIRLAAKVSGGRLYEVPQAELTGTPDMDQKAVELVLAGIIPPPESGKKR